MKKSILFLSALCLTMLPPIAEAGWGKALVGGAVAGAVGGYIAGKVAQPSVQQPTVELPQSSKRTLLCKSSDGASCFAANEYPKAFTIPQYVAKMGFKKYFGITQIICTDNIPACGGAVNFLIQIEVE